MDEKIKKIKEMRKELESLIEKSLSFGLEIEDQIRCNNLIYFFQHPNIQ